MSTKTQALDALKLKSREIIKTRLILARIIAGAKTNLYLRFERLKEQQEQQQY